MNDEDILDINFMITIRFRNKSVIKFIYPTIIAISMLMSGNSCGQSPEPESLPQLQPEEKGKLGNLFNFLKPKPKQTIDSVYVLDDPKPISPTPKAPGMLFLDRNVPRQLFKENNMLLFSLDHLQQPHADKLKLVRGLMKKHCVQYFEGKLLPLKPYGTFTQHTSMVTGVTPDKHNVKSSNGIRWLENRVKIDSFNYDTYLYHFKNNNIVPLWELFKRVPYSRTSIIEEDKAFRDPQVAVYSWPGVKKNCHGVTMDYYQGYTPLDLPKDFTVIDYANQIIKQIEKTRDVLRVWIENYRYAGVPELSMIYFPALDQFYHLYSNKEEAILDKILDALDKVLYEIITAYLTLAPDTTTMVVGDHGGVDLPHENLINIEQILKKFKAREYQIGPVTTIAFKNMKNASEFIEEISDLHGDKIESVTKHEKPNSTEKDETAVVLRVKGNYTFVDDRGTKVIKNSNEHQYGTSINVSHMDVSLFSRPEDNMTRGEGFVDKTVNMINKSYPRTCSDLSDEDKVMASYYLLFGTRVLRGPSDERRYINGNVAQVYSFIVGLFDEFFFYWPNQIQRHDTARFHPGIPYKNNDIAIGKMMVDDYNWMRRLEEISDLRGIP